MSELSPQRKRVVVLCASIACMGGMLPLLERSHPRLMIVWTLFMVVALVFAIVEFGKLKRTER